MSSVEQIKQAVARLSPAELTDFQAWWTGFRGHAGLYEATEEELAAIDRGLREADAGQFATDAEVEAVFAKFRQA